MSAHPESAVAAVARAARRPGRPSTLRRKLTVLVALTGVLPLLLAGGIGLYAIRQTRQQDVFELEQALVHQLADQLEQNLAVRFERYRITVPDPRVRDIPVDQQQNILHQLLADDPSLLAVSFTAVDGQETARLIRDADPGAALPLRDLRSDPSWAMVGTGKEYISDVFSQGGSPVLVLATPTFNQQRQLIATVRAELNLQSLRDSLRSYQLGNEGYFYVITRQGYLVSASPKFVWLRSEAERFPPVVQAQWGEAAARFQTTARSVRQQQVYAVGQQLSSLPWLAVAEWPEGDALSFVYRVSLQLLLLLGLTTLAAVAISALAIRRATRPLQEIGQVIRRLGQGDFQARAAVATNDELQELGDNVNQLGGNLTELQHLRVVQARNAALEESLARERELSRLKDQFLQVTSHQLRTPLTTVQWNLDLSKDEWGKLPAETQELLQEAAQGAVNVNRIIQDLLTVTELGVGYQAKGEGTVDLRALFQTVAEAAASRLTSGQINLTIGEPTATPEVSGDRHALQLALEQLLDNAITYTSPGGQVTVRWEVSAGSAAFTLADTGIGIPAAEIPDLFRQFFRASNAIDRRNVGTGLGLFIVKTVVDGHGGQVRVESTLGQGSAFTITLPRQQKLGVQIGAAAA